MLRIDPAPPPAMPGGPIRSRALAMALGLVLALISGWHALVMSLRVHRFDIAVQLSPSEPVATARLATALSVKAEKSGESPRDIERLARVSLQGNALNAPALRLLAISKGPRLMSRVDQSLVSLAAEVTRRDVGTHLLTIRKAAQSGDLIGTLKAYDIILRHRESQGEQFFPPMAQALQYREMAPHFASFVKQGAPWIPAFLKFAIPASQDPARFAEILRQAGGLGGYEDGPAIEVMVINRLIQIGKAPEAADYYASTAAYRAGVLKSAAINRESLVPRENGLLWTLYPKDGPVAQAIGNRSILVEANPGESGEVARKLLFLAPGTYRLEIDYSDADLPPGTHTSWVARCLEGTSVRELATGRLEGGNERLLGTALVTVGPSCVLDIALAISAAEASEPASATIGDVRIKRVQTR